MRYLKILLFLLVGVSLYSQDDGIPLYRLQYAPDTLSKWVIIGDSTYGEPIWAVIDGLGDTLNQRGNLTILHDSLFYRQCPTCPFNFVTKIDTIIGNEFGNMLRSSDSLYYRECPTCGYDFISKIDTSNVNELDSFYINGAWYYRADTIDTRDSIYAVGYPNGTAIYLRDGEGEAFVFVAEKYLDGYTTTVGASGISPHNQKRINLTVLGKNGAFTPPDYGFVYDDSNYNELGESFIRNDSLFYMRCQECDEYLVGVIDTSNTNELDSIFLNGVWIGNGDTANTITVVDSIYRSLDTIFLRDGSGFVLIDTSNINELDSIFINGVWYGTGDTLNITYDGSETIVTDSTGILVTGSGTVGDPYVITNTVTDTDTDEQDLSDGGRIADIQTINITNGNPVSFSIGDTSNINEIQNIIGWRVGDSIYVTITSGDTVGFYFPPTNTDSQQLSIDSTITVDGKLYNVHLDSSASVAIWIPVQDTVNHIQTLSIDSTGTAGERNFHLGLSLANFIDFIERDRQGIDSMYFVGNTFRFKLENSLGKGLDMSSFMDGLWNKSGLWLTPKLDEDVKVRTIAQNNGGTGTALSTTIRNPRGGNFKSTSPSITGAIKIKLPATTQSTMLVIKGTVYSYLDKKGMNFTISGYETGFSWNKGTSFTDIESPLYQMPIRVYYDGVSKYITIGDTTSTWEYLDVTVTEVIASFSNASEVTWGSGWVVSTTTSTAGHTLLYENLKTGNFGNFYRVKNLGGNEQNGSFYPDALYKNASSSVTGAIKIKVPSYYSTMQKIFISVYDYADGESFEAVVSGYNTSGGGFSRSTSHIISNNTAVNYPIRAYSDSGNIYIYIGDSTQVWGYPAVTVDKIETSFQGGDNTLYRTGWEISISATTPTGTLRHQNLSPNISIDKLWTKTSTNTWLTNQSDNVGIGTNNPTQKLDVVGRVRVSTLDTDLTAPTKSGTIRAVTTDGNGDLSFAPIDSSTTNEIQRHDTFAIVSNILRSSLLNDNVPASIVDLSPYLDNTDDQAIDSLYMVGNTLRLKLEASTGKGVDLSQFVDDGHTYDLEEVADSSVLEFYEDALLKDIVKVVTVIQDLEIGGMSSGGGGVSDHGALTGLGDDDHTQYHNDARGDARYAPLSHVGSGGTTHAVATTSVNGFMSGSDKTKLDGIAAGATVNDTDANLKNRANHTGTQAISTLNNTGGSDGQVVKLVSGVPTWSTDLTGGGGVSDGDYGDITISGSGSAYTVDNGLAATKIADGSVTNAEFQYIGGLTSDAQTQINSKLSSGASAGGDLSGTLPNPTVAKIQGVSVLSGTPTNGHVLTYSTANSRWEATAPSGGGSVTMDEATGTSTITTSNTTIGDMSLAAGTWMINVSGYCTTNAGMTVTAEIYDATAASVLATGQGENGTIEIIDYHITKKITIGSTSTIRLRARTSNGSCSSNSGTITAIK